MTDTMIRPGVLLAPVPQPIKGTLFDTVEVSPNFPWQDTSGLYESYNCLTTDYTAVLPCPVNTLAAPTQTAATTATTGGTLAAGTYKAIITGLNSRGETVGSNEISRVTTGSTSTITWNWNALTGATGYNVYVTGVGGSVETYLVTVGAVTTYVWTGTPAFSSTNATPPTTNTAVVPVTKTFNGPSWQDAIKFAVYTGVICKAVGFDEQRAASEMERVFNNKESEAVARALMQQRFIVSASHWAAATDLTPAGGAVDPSVGLAILEEHAAINYAGEPVIHMPRSIGSLVTRNGQADLDGNVLRSSLGTPIAADPGYGQAYATTGTEVNNGPANTVPSAGELWCYATGKVTVAAGQVFQSEPLIDLVETGDSNRIRLLRERPYIATVDCYTAAVRVKVQ